MSNLDQSTLRADSGPAALVRTPLPLFERYPRLQEQLPHVPLGEFPTPVQTMPRLGEAIGLGRLYIKRDDLSGRVYGGNKVRKLEFLLAEALEARAREVITFGFAGSNHALATAIYARQLGLRCTALLLPQINAQYVRSNLLAGFHHGSDLRYYSNQVLLGLGLVRKLLQGRIRDGAFPRVIPAGGSCPLGVLGYINAALELKQQIAAGELPEPDRVYVPLGSMGTAVGLALGLKLAGLKSQVVAVRVIEEQFAGRKRLVKLLHDTVAFLRRLDPGFPQLTVDECNLTIRNDCLGAGYARFTEGGASAAELIGRTEGITTNGAYSAKALAALLADAADGSTVDQTVLFWNTFNSRDLSMLVAGADCRRLPRAFHRYFEQDVQPLDHAPAYASPAASSPPTLAIRYW